MEIVDALDRLHCTVEGNNGMPVWYLRLLAPVTSIILAQLFNQLVKMHHVPSHPMENLYDST